MANIDGTLAHMRMDASSSALNVVARLVLGAADDHPARRKPAKR